MLPNAQGGGRLEVAVDLRETTFADSSILHVLLDAHRKFYDFGGALTVGPNEDHLLISQ